ncbi:MAG: acetate/propionate family kinase [Candidatus Saccharibacteria bacterium]
MAVKSLVLVVNPGSSSRKYALFAGGTQKASIYFEFEDGGVIGTLEFDGQKQVAHYDDSDLNSVSRYVYSLLQAHKVIEKTQTLDIIGIRIVAPSRRFMSDELVTPEVEADLKALRQKAPLHITTDLVEIRQFEHSFPGVPVVAVSDSSFHATLPVWAWHYGIDVSLAEEFDIRRYGCHGISVESVVRNLKEHNLLASKTIVCHLGSGSSLTAIENGESVDTTMGYSPLEGLMMATRSGTIDVAAALAIKHELKLTDDGLGKYLNKQSGLLGVSGSSSDIRQLLTSEADGDERANLALKLFVYRIQLAVGQMAASMGGVDSLVFTATIGERSSIIRSRVLDGLGYLGFRCDDNLNDQAFEPTGPVNIGTPVAKPVFVVSTNESTEIVRRAELYIDTHLA